MKAFVIFGLLLVSFASSAKANKDWYLVPKYSCMLSLTDSYESKFQLPNSRASTSLRREQNEDSLTANIKIKSISCTAVANYNTERKQLENQLITISTGKNVWTSRGPRNKGEQQGMMSVSTDNAYATCSCWPDLETVFSN